MNKIIIVTGASKGIGKEIAKKLAKKGNTIIANYNKSEKEIKEHKIESYDARLEMTDAFLQILVDLGNYSTRECADKKMRKDLESIKDKMYKIARDYGIKQELSYDDGDIIFKDFEREI